MACNCAACLRRSASAGPRRSSLRPSQRGTGAFAPSDKPHASFWRPRGRSFASTTVQEWDAQAGALGLLPRRGGLPAMAATTEAGSNSARRARPPPSGSSLANGGRALAASGSSKIASSRGRRASAASIGRPPTVLLTLLVLLLPLWRRTTLSWGPLYVAAILKVLGQMPDASHLGEAILAAERKKLLADSKSVASTASDAARCGKAHEALQRAEKAYRKAAEERGTCETRLAKLVATETKAREVLRAAREELTPALERRKLDAELLISDKLSSLACGTLIFGGQELQIDTEDSKVIAALAVIQASHAVKIAAKAVADDSSSGHAEELVEGRGVEVDGGSIGEPSKRKAPPSTSRASSSLRAAPWPPPSRGRVYNLEAHLAANLGSAGGLTDVAAISVGLTERVHAASPMSRATRRSRPRGGNAGTLRMEFANISCWGPKAMASVAALDSVGESIRVRIASRSWKCISHLPGSRAPCSGCRRTADAVSWRLASRPSDRHRTSRAACSSLGTPSCRSPPQPTLGVPRARLAAGAGLSLLPRARAQPSRLRRCTLPTGRGARRLAPKSFGASWRPFARPVATGT